MQILIVNTFDIHGGAARAAYRLHRALLNAEVKSQMLVQSKMTDDYTVIGPRSKIERAICKVRPILDSMPVRFYKRRTKTLFSPSWVPFSEMARRINSLNPDIVHLHWVAGGLLGINEINKIKAPIVWSLHDDWVFTGGCHIKWSCDKYKDRCGACPNLNSTTEHDLSRIIWNIKKSSFSRLQYLTLIAPSKWLAGCAKESSLLKDRRIVNLPNLIDTKRFRPLAKSTARDILGLPKNKRLILFGAYSATTDINKGFKELSAALNLIQRDDVEFIVFGSREPIDTQQFKHKTHYMGHLYDDISLAVLYSAADVMVVPSIQEAFSQTTVESMSCGTPIVAFGATGLLDIVDHQKNGYLAKPFEIDDLAKGIEWILNSTDYEGLCRNARDKITAEFDEKAVVKQYIDLYHEVMCRVG
jgi:glycosyltransferase involved in cell wall biosynthesis